MVKSIEFIDELIFDYLGKDDYAQFIALTGLCDGIRLNDGVVWAQFNEFDEITAVVATSRNGKSLVFAHDDADIDELSFIADIEKDKIDKTLVGLTKNKRKGRHFN